MLLHVAVVVIITRNRRREAEQKRVILQNKLLEPEANPLYNPQDLFSSSKLDNYFDVSTHHLTLIPEEIPSNAIQVLQLIGSGLV